MNVLLAYFDCTFFSWNYKKANQLRESARVFEIGISSLPYGCPWRVWTLLAASRAWLWTRKVSKLERVTWPCSFANAFYPTQRKKNTFGFLEPAYFTAFVQISLYFRTVLLQPSLKDKCDVGLVFACVPGKGTSLTCAQSNERSYKWTGLWPGVIESGDYLSWKLPDNNLPYLPDNKLHCVRFKKNSQR